MSHKVKALLFSIMSAIFLFIAVDRYMESAHWLRIAVSAVGAICFAMLAITLFYRETDDRQAP